MKTSLMKIKQISTDVKDYVAENKNSILIGAGAGAVLVPAAVLAVGFAPSGIVAGSLAAAAQSSVGNVAAGSAFAGM